MNGGFSCSTRAGLFALLGFSVAVLAGCAQYQAYTNKALGYHDRAERLFVWTALGEVPFLRRKQMLANDSFENYFNATLKRMLAEEGIVTDVRQFSPKTDTIEQLHRFETDVAPTARLLIQPARYQMYSYGGGTTVSALWLDMSLYDVKSNRRVWRGQLYVDPGLSPSSWWESGAQELSARVIAALRKDDLIAPAKNNVSRKQPTPASND